MKRLPIMLKWTVGSGLIALSSLVMLTACEQDAGGGGGTGDCPAGGPGDGDGDGSGDGDGDGDDSRWDDEWTWEEPPDQGSGDLLDVSGGDPSEGYELDTPINVDPGGVAGASTSTPMRWAEDLHTGIYFRGVSTTEARLNGWSEHAIIMAGDAFDDALIGSSEITVPIAAADEQDEYRLGHLDLYLASIYTGGLYVMRKMASDGQTRNYAERPTFFSYAPDLPVGAHYFPDGDEIYGTATANGKGLSITGKMDDRRFKVVGPLLDKELDDAPPVGDGEVYIVDTEMGTEPIWSRMNPPTDAPDIGTWDICQATAASTGPGNGTPALSLREHIQCDRQHTACTITSDAMDDMLDNWKFRRGKYVFDGAKLKEMKDSAGNPNGLKVLNCTATNACGLLGFQSGDKLTAIGSTTVASYADAGAALAQTCPGNDIVIHYKRSGTAKSMVLTIDDGGVEAEGQHRSGQCNDYFNNDPQVNDGADWCDPECVLSTDYGADTYPTADMPYEDVKAFGMFGMASTCTGLGDAWQAVFAEDGALAAQVVNWLDPVEEGEPETQDRGPTMRHVVSYCWTSSEADASDIEVCEFQGLNCPDDLENGGYPLTGLVDWGLSSVPEGDSGPGGVMEAAWPYAGVFFDGEVANGPETLIPIHQAVIVAPGANTGSAARAFVDYDQYLPQYQGTIIVSQGLGGWGIAHELVHTVGCAHEDETDDQHYWQAPNGNLIKKLMANGGGSVPFLGLMDAGKDQFLDIDCNVVMSNYFPSPINPRAAGFEYTGCETNDDCWWPGNICFPGFQGSPYKRCVTGF